MRRRVLVGMLLVGACNAYGTSGSTDDPSKTDAGAADAASDAKAEEADANDSRDSASDAMADGGACAVEISESFASGLPIGWAQNTTLGTLGTTSNGELEASVTASASSGAIALLTRAAAGLLPTRASVTYGVRFSSVSGAYVEGGCTLLARKSGDGSYYSLFPYVSNATVHVEDEAKSGTQAFSTEPGAIVQPLDTTHTYRVRAELLDLTPAGARAVVAVDNVTLIDRVVTFPAAMDVVTISCGAYAATSASAVVVIDDVTLAICH